MAIAAAAIAASALWLVDDRGEQVAIERIPAAERQALYERTVRTLQSSCDPAKKPEGLEDFCRRQAEFIVQFPECDAACRSLAKPYQRKQTR